MKVSEHLRLYAQAMQESPVLAATFGFNVGVIFTSALFGIFL